MVVSRTRALVAALVVPVAPALVALAVLLLARW
jgi:hypothetical protein